MPASPTPLPSLTDVEFHRISAAVLAAIEARADRWLQEDVVDIDTQRTGGLLELSFPAGSKIVINTQPPLHELWLAARSGGYHFRYVGGAWRNTRSGEDFWVCLTREVSSQAGLALTFDLSGSA